MTTRGESRSHKGLRLTQYGMGLMPQPWVTWGVTGVMLRGWSSAHPCHLHFTLGGIRSAIDFKLARGNVAVSNFVEDEHLNRQCDRTSIETSRVGLCDNGHRDDGDNNVSSRCQFTNLISLQLQFCTSSVRHN